MKVSKLFHWCYAFLMLLPLIAIGSTILVNTFNKQQEVKYLYETNDVNSIDDIKLGNIYHIDLRYLDTESNLSIKCDNLFNIVLEGNEVYLNETYLDDKDWCNISVIHEEIDTFLYSFLYYDYVSSIQLTDYYLYYSYEVDNFTSSDNTFNFSCDFIPNKIVEFDTSYLKYIKRCNLDNIPTEKIKTNFSNIFYNSIEKVKQSDLFAWSYDSFLVVPFAYITNLFSMPTNSFVVCMLSYWLSISIIWLVFDLVMYVPLLVHRWIDKGVLE